MPTPKPSRAKHTPAARKHEQLSTSSAFERAMHEMRHSPSAFPNVSARWLLSAALLVFIGALLSAWLTLCLLYWQGSWQLLYHPKAAITTTPASVNLPFEPIHFAATETGINQLTGWWLPAQQPPSKVSTLLYLHGADGNLSETIPSLAALHTQGLSIFAIDYRGYGQSQPIIQAGHPYEKQLRQDAEWALTWLTLTRYIPATQIVVYGSGMGANLAAQLAADHSELAGVILDEPLQNAMAPVFNDPRSHLVPAHWLVRDRYDLDTAAAKLHIPSLWLLTQPAQNQPALPPQAYQSVGIQKTLAWLNPPIAQDPHFTETLHRWLDDL
jgi:pimeloyl-ACP methyl ester carboxylesterase